VSQIPHLQHTPTAF